MLKINRYLKKASEMRRVSSCLARAAATSAIRSIDSSDPNTWEFSGFSQNGEDGIIDELCRRLKDKNRYFIEIGASDGVECSTAWLAVARRYSGLMIEGDPQRAALGAACMRGQNCGVKFNCAFATKENIPKLLKCATFSDPDVFALDIDGMDMHIVNAIFSHGFRPKIFLVEYNSAFGPSKSLTIPYSENFNYRNAHKTHLYYGCSIRAWRNLFEAENYRFICVDLNGVNAFFVDVDAFDLELLDKLQGLSFRENYYRRQHHGTTWEGQFELIKEMPFQTV